MNESVPPAAAVSGALPTPMVVPLTVLVAVSMIETSAPFALGR